MNRYLAMIVWVALVSTVGCSAPTVSQRKSDQTLTRFSKAGSEAFSEGNVDHAIQAYRAALLRAWAMDDPYEAGTNAYNLAACLTSLGQSDAARNWLLDARVELCRAGSSTGNVWLMEAKIAIDEGRFDQASEYLRHAECSNPPCDVPEACCFCGPHDPCGESCVTKIPCVGSRVANKRAIEDCRNDFQAQIHLARAALAAEQFDTDTARDQLHRACALAEHVCGNHLQAELQHVAALIHLAEGQFLRAACHFDAEAKYLRLAKNYREIPHALDHAAAAFEQAERTDLAVSRMCRIARIRIGRGDARKAWQQLQAASALVSATDCESTRMRLTLVAQEIERVLSEAGESHSQMIE